ncbi:MAG: cyclase [Anaerolineae bacterium]|nr:cyclase [Anaerolineae bacterium]
MNLRQEIHNLLQNVGSGNMSYTAYDTAWIARLREIGDPLSGPATEWLRANQLPDGSWGTQQPYYSHDRVICTLAAINAFARHGRRQDHERLRKAESALNTAIKGLDADSAGETVGFELIVPTLLYEAQILGALHHQEDQILTRLMPYRSAKLAAMGHHLISRFVTLAHSAEMAGFDNVQQLLDAENLQEVNGSVGLSPAATAYFALYVRRGDPAALEYLHAVAPQGIAPDAAPLNIFERSWVLWNLALTGMLTDDLKTLCDPHLDFLEAVWKPGHGVGFADCYTPTDSDDTSLTYETLIRLGRSVDLEAVLHYGHIYHYRCFDLESTPSISANIHVLGALRQAALPKEHPSVQKVIKFLSSTQIDHSFWFDKWHVSPYYATTQAVIACAGYANELVTNAVDWLLTTQKDDGSWGYYSYMSTAEETAYCLQALMLWKQHGHQIPNKTLTQGKIWLLEHIDLPYPALWIDKCLYCPELIVRSAILSALALLEQE